MVVLIVGLLLGGLTVTLSAQHEARQFAETQAKLDLARDALIGFAIRNGRLPCPATTSGAEVPPTAEGQCADFYGLLPAMTLGIATSDGKGYMLDAWNMPIRYAVTKWEQPSGTYPFTKTSGMSNVGVAALEPRFRICSAASCATELTGENTVPAVIFSTGKNRLIAGHGADEAENFDNDNNFVAHEPRPAGAVGDEFDDVVVWLSVNVLVNRMVAAGSL